MSRDTAVYVRRATTIPINDILTQMRERDISLVWQIDPLTELLEDSSADTWTAGSFSPEGDRRSQSQIEISTEELDAEAKQRLITTYQDRLTEAQRQHLTSAQTQYLLHTVWSADENRDRALLHLIDTLAELGDGLILDLQTNQFYDRDQYRQQYLNFFDLDSQ